eukprot:scaffold18381_cov20-Tisochrysis_lutea.AAC.1
MSLQFVLSELFQLESAGTKHTAPAAATQKQELQKYGAYGCQQFVHCMLFPTGSVAGSGTAVCRPYKRRRVHASQEAACIKESFPRFRN